MTLPNGLTVVVAEQHTAPLVETTVWYRFGSSDETPGKTGLAHALEHMMFRGTPSLSASGLEAFVGHFGGRFNAATDEDFTQFYFVLPATELETVLRIEADRMQHLSLDPKDWQAERGAVLDEIDRFTSNPLARLFTSVRAAAAQTTGYRLPALGNRADVAAASVDDLRAYYSRWYAPNNAVVTIVGDVNAEEAFAAAKRAFADIPRRTVPEHPATSVAPPAQSSITLQGDFPFEVVDLAYRAPGSGSADSDALYDLQNLAHAIDDQRGPFFKNIVQTGLAVAGLAIGEYHLGSSTTHAMYVVAPGHTGPEVRAAFESTARSAAGGAIPDDLVVGARTRIVADDTFARDSLDGLSRLVGDLYVRERHTVTEDIALTKAVTPAAVRAAAAKYFAAPIVFADFQPKVTAFTGLSTSGLLGGAADNFAARQTDGAVIQPYYVRRDMQKFVSFSSRIAPTEFTVAGIRVLVQPFKGNGTVFVSGSLRESPAFDPAGKEGLGEVALSLLGYGGTSSDFETTEQTLASLGASLTVGSKIRARCFTNDFETVAGLLADGLSHPAFPQRYVDFVLQRQAAAVSRIDAVPEYRFERQFSELLLPRGDPELRQPTVASIASIKRDDIVAYAARFVRPEFLTLAVVGDVDPQRVRVAFERTFGAWKPSGGTPDAALPRIPRRESTRASIVKSTDAVSVRVGGPGPARGDRDYDALDVATTLLAGASDSRLMTELRQKRGLVYAVSGKLNADRDRGTLQFDFSTARPDLERSRTIFFSELKRMRTELVDEGELEGARQVLISRAFVDEDNSTSIADELNSLGENDLPKDYYQTLQLRYALVSAQAVRAAVVKYMDPAHLVEVDQGPNLGPG